MALYETLLELDTIGPIAGMLQPRPMWIDPDGKVYCYQRVVPGVPWVWYRVESERSCGLWHQIYFDRYKLVPKGCRYCWKTVWTGTTLDQLFRVAEIQAEMKMEAKCGIETRSWSGKLGKYQGFWYAPMNGGLAGGRSRYKEVAERFAKDKLVGGTGLILKRGCTEMEQFFSPSDTWEELAEKGDWDKKEEMLNETFVPPVAKAEGGILKICSQLRWIEYAWEHGDPTVTGKYPNKYLERPLTPRALQYQRSIHSEKDYSGWEGSSDQLDVEESTRSRPTLVTKF